MTPITNQMLLFKDILSKFFEVLYISENELEKMMDYIFSDENIDTLTNDESEIYETLIYLRDIVQECNYTTLEELHNYFESQESSLNKLIEPLLSEGGEDLTGLKICRIYNGSFKTAAIKALTSCHFNSVALDRNEVVRNLYQCVSNDDKINGLEKSYQELQVPQWFDFMNLFKSHHNQTSIAFNTDNFYYRNYFEFFSYPGKKYSNSISVFEKIKSWFRFFWNDPKKIKSNIAFNKKRQRKIKSIYQKVFEEIHAEEPIKNDEFKMMLSRMMLTSKFSNAVFKDHLRQVNLKSDSENISAHVEFSDFMAKKSYYKNLTNKKWSILKSPHGLSWITTDNPGFSIDIDPIFKGNDKIEVDPYWTDIDDKKMIYFPLSKDYCLRLEPIFDRSQHNNFSIDQSIIFEVSTEEEVKTVNKLVISTKPAVLISEEKGIQKLNCISSCI